MKTMTVERINWLLDGSGYQVGYKATGRVSSLYTLIDPEGNEVMCDRTLNPIRVKATELAKVDLISD